MRRETIICDVCGKSKQQTNHWFVVSLSGDIITIFGRDSQLDVDGKRFDCCGESCVLKKVSELIKKA